MLFKVHFDIDFQWLLVISSMSWTKNWIWFAQHEIIEAGDKGQKKYEDDIDVAERIEPELNNALSNTTNAKRAKLNAPFT